MVKDEPLSDESADVIVLADREEDVSTYAYLSVRNLELWLTSWLPAGQHSSSSLSLSSAAEIELPGKKTWGGPSQTGTDTMQKAETSGRQQIHLFE